MRLLFSQAFSRIFPYHFKTCLDCLQRLDRCNDLQEDPEPTKAKLEAFLESRGIPYKYGTKTKFANFRQRTLE